MYYELGHARWEWQRARMFETVEDKFPSTYVLKYITPMLENAGANVLMPRERDTNPHEVIVDNDRQLATSPYAETNGSKAWQNGEKDGFAYTRETYRDEENPFHHGTYRQAETVTDDNALSTIAWTPVIPEARRYAVYVSYKTVENSASDAHYTVYHKGGATHFLVNQSMGSGTWIYLGTFTFDKGTTGKVVLTNQSAEEGKVITADAVRFGGGMGNIARAADGSLTYDNTKIKKGKARAVARPEDQTVETVYETSGYPRWMEAARYYLQWAGMPESVYAVNHGRNDYSDDIRSRGNWVNYMAGGSRKLPMNQGLNIPIDLSLAFHTDGGSVGGNRIIGTLGIYHGGSELCNTVYKSIVSDIRKEIEPRWAGRGITARNYSETSIPQVPSMLLELLSHESFGEMRYGLDPRFQFVVSRAIYKGILKYLSKRNGYSYIVQPLPVTRMAITMPHNGEVRLTWQAVTDSLEETAKADRFVVYKRVGSGDFDNGTIVSDSIYTCSIPQNQVVSFRVTALNDGGQSMPSETLSAGWTAGSEKPVLVINGFDRISAPDDFSSSDDKLAGFLADQDNGVDYGTQISYIGSQKEFRRSIPMRDDDSPGFGACNADMEKMEIAGNTFDYPSIHGTSLLRAGRSFVSVSRSAVDSLLTMTNDSVCHLQEMYSAIDLILGKQKQSKLGRKDAQPLAFKTFDQTMQQLLTRYCKAGGNVFVSGAYVGTDLWQNPLSTAKDADKQFARTILKYKWMDGKACTDGRVKYVPSPLPHEGNGTLEYYSAPNSQSYAVESPDAIIPADNHAATAFRYAETGQSAGVVFSGDSTDNWKTVVLGFPFESIKQQNTRDDMMKHIMDFLTK